MKRLKRVRHPVAMLLVSGAVLTLPTTAGAAGRVSLVDDPALANDERITYAGDDAVNQLHVGETFESGTRWVVVEDGSGTVLAGSGCQSVSERAARCVLPDSAAPRVAIQLAGGDDAATVDLNAQKVAIEGGSGDDAMSVTGRAAGSTLSGGPGRDRLISGGGEDLLYVDEDDAEVDGGAGRDEVMPEPGETGMPAAVACGAGRDLVTPELQRRRPRTIPLLGKDCERLVNFGPHPTKQTRRSVTFRVRCQQGNFEYADHRCHARLRLRSGGKLVASGHFTARNDRAVSVRLPATRRLKRAIRKRAIVDVQLAAFEYWDSDNEEFDEQGNYYWRIQLGS